MSDLISESILSDFSHQRILKMWLLSSVWILQLTFNIPLARELSFERSPLRMHIHKRKHTHTHKHTHTYRSAHTYAHTYAYIYIYIYVCVCVCVCVCVSVRVYLKFRTNMTAQSAGTGELTDCVSAEGSKPLSTSVLYRKLNHRSLRLQSWIFEQYGVLFRGHYS